MKNRILMLHVLFILAFTLNGVAQEKLIVPKEIMNLIRK